MRKTPESIASRVIVAVLQLGQLVIFSISGSNVCWRGMSLPQSVLPRRHAALAQSSAIHGRNLAGLPARFRLRHPLRRSLSAVRAASSSSDRLSRWCFFGA